MQRGKVSRGENMAESGASRQKSNEREEQRGSQLQRGSGGIQRRSGYFPLLSPKDFFTSSPLGLMRRFADEMDRALAGFAGLSSGTPSGEELTWIPPVEVREDGNNLVVRAELPGLTEKDVRVEATPEGLVISGERRQEQSNEEGGVQRSEIVYGNFWRLIPLPEGAQVENANANFENGILQVIIPIPESQQRRRQIPISSGGAQGTSGTGASSTQRARSASQSS
jgi:HSP20 family protein